MGAGVLVVVVDEASGADVEVEEPSGAAVGEDALRGPPDLRGVLEPFCADAALQREQFGFCGVGGLRGAGCVAAGAGSGLDGYGAGPVGEGDVCGAAAVLGDLDPVGVFVDGREKPASSLRSPVPDPRPSRCLRRWPRGLLWWCGRGAASLRAHGRTRRRRLRPRCLRRSGPGQRRRGRGPPRTAPRGLRERSSQWRRRWRHRRTRGARRGSRRWCTTARPRFGAGPLDGPASTRTPETRTAQTPGPGPRNRSRPSHSTPAPGPDPSNRAASCTGASRCRLRPRRPRPRPCNTGPPTARTTTRA